MNSHCVIYTFEENQQQHRSAAPHCVLRGNLFKDVQVLGASAWCGLFPATVWWDLLWFFRYLTSIFMIWYEGDVSLAQVLESCEINRIFLCLSRLHRWIHRRNQRKLVQFQPLHVRNGCTCHSCASKITPHRAFNNHISNCTVCAQTM